MAMPLTNAQADIAYILGEAAHRYGEQDRDLFERAYQFGRRAHEGQFRRSGEDFFCHCLEVTRLLAELRMDPATLAAGLLHDVIEDTSVTVEDLREEFPEPIPQLVEYVTKLSALHFSSDREAQVATLRKMILAMAQDVRVIIIKLCDRLHNMRTLESLAEPKQRRIAKSTLDVYAPLANRLGMARIRAELEDLSMYVLYPAAYAHMRNRVAKRRAERESIVQRSIEALDDHLRRRGLDFRLYGRPKHFYSIYQKMQAQSLTFDQIYDLIALRIITDTVQHCYEIVGHLHSLWHPVPGRFKDYIALPKDNGYQSIHTTVIGLGGEVTEVQIRTGDMHEMAEEGIAAHWRYKEGMRAGQQERLNWLRRLVGWLQDVRDPTEFMDALKQDIFSAEVFCFTPKGDVVELPAGSTPLDFAYHIHTEVGNHCSEARINGKIAPIRSEIKMGDVVEIVTSRTARPNPGWLKIATTSRARSKIRHYLKTVDFEKNRRHGMEMLQKAISARHLSIPASELPKRLERSFVSFKVNSFEELLSEIGFGAISAGSVAGRLLGEQRAEQKRVRKKKSPASKEEPDRMIVEGLSSAMVRTANCCAPLPGDPIIGFVTRGRGITVHRNDCPNLQRVLRNGDQAADRLITVRWGQGEQPPREVMFRIQCEDRPGLLHSVSQVFADLHLNIVEINSSTRKTRASLRITAEIHTAQQMGEIIKNLQRVNGVKTVTRVIRAGENAAE